MITNEQLIEKLLERPVTDFESARNLFDMAQNLKDRELGRVCFRRAAKAMKMLTGQSKKARDPALLALEFKNLYENIMDWLAVYYFDEYMMALERNRPANERFYLPRRKQLKPIVDALQELADDELDELFLSQPPRTGKTTLMLFFKTWIAGRDPESSNLYCSFAASVAEAFYDGILEIVGDPETYRWAEIFTTGKVVATSAKNHMIDFGREKRYKTISCRSIDSGLNGLIDVSGILTADDLLSGISEAMNPDILENRWATVRNNMLSRAKSSARIIWEGTRWSLKDPIGRRLEELENNPALSHIRYKVVNVPALDPVTDESNFDYLYDVGFDTQYYRALRASFESSGLKADWDAQYQGEPYEKNGTLYNAADLNYYHGSLPDTTPDKTIMVVDVAWGGGDNLSAPIAKCFDNDVYIDAVIYDKGDKFITRPRVVKAIIEHKVGELVIEGNNGGSEYAEWVSTELHRLGYHDIVVRTRRTPPNKRKEDRIYVRAPEAKEYYYRATGSRDADYMAFMRDLTTYSITGKNKHDDAPDSMAMMVEAVRGRGVVKSKISARPF